MRRVKGSCWLSAPPALPPPTLLCPFVPSTLALGPASPGPPCMGGMAGGEEGGASRRFVPVVAGSVAMTLRAPAAGVDKSSCLVPVLPLALAAPVLPVFPRPGSSWLPDPHPAPPGSSVTPCGCGAAPARALPPGPGPNAAPGAPELPWKPAVAPTSLEMDPASQGPASVHLSLGRGPCPFPSPSVWPLPRGQLLPQFPSQDETPQPWPSRWPSFLWEVRTCPTSQVTPPGLVGPQVAPMAHPL